MRHERASFMPQPEAMHMPQLSSLKYHAPSHRMLMTSRAPTRNIGISYFSPEPIDPDSNEGMLAVLFCFPTGQLYERQI